MKNISILVLAIFFTSGSVFSQDKTPAASQTKGAVTEDQPELGCLSINFGASMPVGDFKNADIYNENSGFAKSGFQYSVSYQHIVYKRFGLLAKFRGESNAFDSQKLAEEFMKVYDNSYHFSASSDSWTSRSLLIGGYFSLPAAKKVVIEPKVLFGYTSVTNPPIIISGYTGQGYASTVSEEKTGTAISLLIGVGLKVELSDKINFLADVEYFSAKPKFDNVKTTANDGSVFFSSYKQPITTVNIGIGIGYRFTK